MRPCSNLERHWLGTYTKGTHLKTRGFNEEKFLYVGNKFEKKSSGVLKFRIFVGNQLIK